MVSCYRLASHLGSVPPTLWSVLWPRIIRITSSFRRRGLVSEVIKLESTTFGTHCVHFMSFWCVRPHCFLLSNIWTATVNSFTHTHFCYVAFTTLWLNFDGQRREDCEIIKPQRGSLVALYKPVTPPPPAVGAADVLPHDATQTPFCYLILSFLFPPSFPSAVVQSATLTSCSFRCRFYKMSPCYITHTGYFLLPVFT